MIGRLCFVIIMTQIWLNQKLYWLLLRLCNIFSETMTGQSTDTLLFCLSSGKKRHVGMKLQLWAEWESQMVSESITGFEYENKHLWASPCCSRQSPVRFGKHRQEETEPTFGLNWSTHSYRICLRRPCVCDSSPSVGWNWSAEGSYTASWGKFYCSFVAWKISIILYWSMNLFS